MASMSRALTRVKQDLAVLLPDAAITDACRAVGPAADARENHEVTQASSHPGSHEGKAQTFSSRRPLCLRAFVVPNAPAGKS